MEEVARKALERITPSQLIILLHRELRSRFLLGLTIGFLAGWGLFFILWVWILDSPRLF